MASTERRHRKHSKHKHRHKHNHRHHHGKHKKRGRDKEKERLRRKEETPEVIVGERELQTALEQLEKAMIAVRARYPSKFVMHSTTQLHIVCTF